MLSPEEYESLKSDRENIFKFHETGNYNGHGMQTIDAIRQRRGYHPVCYTCDGDKIEAVKDAYNFIVEYEENCAEAVNNGQP